MSPDLHEWNNRIIMEFRANAGFVHWSTDDDLAQSRPVPSLLPGFDPHRSVPIILVTHTGARTGRERTSPLMSQPVGDAFAVFATYGGSPQLPAWYRNITTNPHVTVEAGTQVMLARARATDGAEREHIWADQVQLMAVFAEFQQKAGRQIPVVMLEPTSDSTTDTTGGTASRNHW